MNFLHLREFGKRFERPANGRLLHLADRKVHPDERSRDEQEEQHEATRPQPGEIVEDAEQDGQNEAAEPADHADGAAHGADAVGVIYGDVLVDRGLAERHEEAEHEDRRDESDDPHFQMERDRTLDAAHGIVGRRIGQDEGAGDGGEQAPVHHPAGAVAVGEMTSVGPQQTGGDRERGGEHARRLDVQSIDLDQILRQPEREGDEGAEDEEVVEREAPDLDIRERRELQPQAVRLRAPGAALQRRRVFRCREPEDGGDEQQTGRPDLRNRLPAVGDQHKGGEELGDGRADIAGAKDAQRGPLLFRGKPLRDIGDADRE